MITSPSIDDLLESVVLAIGADILPNLDNGKAIATASMMQSVLTGIRQMLPVYDHYIVDEHNEMAKVLRDAAAMLDGVDGEAADRVRERAATLGVTPDLPSLPDVDGYRAAHRELSTALGDTMADLDVLQRVGVEVADGALDLVRLHLAKRLPRYAATISLEGGLIGRG